MPPRIPSRISPPSILVWSESSSTCPSCTTNSFRRLYSAQATATSLPITETTPIETSASATPVSHKLLASVILSRPPQITRDLHPFEKAYYLYQRRLNERTALPFTRFFYLNDGTPQMLDFRKKIKERKTVARDIGVYDAYSREAGWNDELLMGAVESDPEHQKDAILNDEFVEKREGSTDTALEQLRAKTRPQSRITEADKSGDDKSLDRMLQRTLYLLVKNSNDLWTFPTASVDGKESLNRAAVRTLDQTTGVNMHTWILSNHPVGHLKRPYSEADIKTNDAGHLVSGELVFFMKGRIMAGQADLQNNLLGAKDFKWLAKEEIQPLVHRKYWSAVENLLPAR